MVAENSICVEIVEVVDLLLAFIRHTQPYINDAQFPVQPISSPSRNAGRDHRALPSTDCASTNAKDMGFSAATDGRGSGSDAFSCGQSRSTQLNLTNTSFGRFTDR